jgi:hypothetical protein
LLKENSDETDVTSISREDDVIVEKKSPWFDPIMGLNLLYFQLETSIIKITSPMQF